MNKFYRNLLIFIVCFGFNALIYAEESSASSSSEESSSSSSTPSNNPIYTNGYNQGFAEGMALCQKSPRACGISLNATIGGITEEEIKTECRLDPASCGIEMGNADGSTEEGIAQCKNDPKSCDIDVEQDIACPTQTCTEICQNNPADCGINMTGTLEEGIQQCQNDPLSCGINQNTDGSTDMGIEQCQNDPLSCGISVNPSVNDAVQEIIAQCQKNPSICGINTSTPHPDEVCTPTFVHGSLSLSDGTLYLPAIDVPTAFDGTVTTYQVQMELIPGRSPLSFSTTNVVPI